MNSYGYALAYGIWPLCAMRVKVKFKVPLAVLTVLEITVHSCQILIFPYSVIAETAVSSQILRCFWKRLSLIEANSYKTSR